MRVIAQKRNQKTMQRLSKAIGVVSIVALSLAAAAESSAQYISDLPDKDVCQMALNREGEAWQQSSTLSGYVAEAAKRGLTVNACRQLFGEKPLPPTSNSSASTLTDRELCLNALNREQTAWNQDSTHDGYIAEASRRSWTVDSCRELLKTGKDAYIEQSPRSAAAQEEWHRPDSRIGITLYTSVKGEGAVTVMAYSQNRVGKTWGPYTPVYGQNIRNVIECKEDEKVCMGAWTATGQTWGQGNNKQNWSCTDCCFRCDGWWWYWQLHHGYANGGRAR